ncbi:MAG: hypothetical protein HY901_35090 [Deltaproteobacteria bacterium]|nr:hypothetical protein [Deltaproteobacteria bacterium]
MSNFPELLRDRIERHFPCGATRDAYGLLQELKSVPVAAWTLPAPLEDRVRVVRAALQGIVARYERRERLPQGFAGFVLVEFVVRVLDVTSARGSDLARRRGDLMSSILVWRDLPATRQDTPWLPELTDAFFPPAETIAPPAEFARAALFVALGRPLGTFFPGEEGRQYLQLLSSVYCDEAGRAISAQAQSGVQAWQSKFEPLEIHPYDPLAYLTTFLSKALALHRAMAVGDEEGKLNAYFRLKALIESLLPKPKALSLIRPLFGKISVPKSLRTIAPPRGPKAPSAKPFDPYEMISDDEDTIPDGRVPGAYRH